VTLNFKLTGIDIFGAHPILNHATQICTSNS